MVVRRHYAKPHIYVTNEYERNYHVPLTFLEALGEVGSGFPWLYSGWLLIFSPRYRKNVDRKYRSQGPLIFCHWAISFIFLAVEVVLVLYFVVSGEAV